MSLLDSLPSLLMDPPPAYVFEVSEAGIAFASTRHRTEVQFHEYEPGIVSVSPARDNVQRPEMFTAHVSALIPQNGNRKRRGAALILPDHSARVQVLDFDSFPGNAGEQAALIRFRVKKSVPFDVESAAVSYHAQPAPDGGKIEVVAAVASLEIVARYEAAFRSAGYHPGLVTTSALAALNLLPSHGVTVFAKLGGRVLSVVVQDGARVRLVRTVELDNINNDDMLAVLHPTLAYIEDQLLKKAERLLLCGFGSATPAWASAWQTELDVPVEAAQSRIGAPGPYNAGLLGYLEGSGVLQ
jgi:type IV pilus assembly protein PilM